MTRRGIHAIVSLVGLTTIIAFQHPRLAPYTGSISKTTALHAAPSLNTAVDELQAKFSAIEKDVAKTCKVRVEQTSTNRFGLVATQSISKGDVILSMPYEDSFMFTADTVKKTLLKEDLPDTYQGWTGDNGILALAVLNELARVAGAGGQEIPVRSVPLQAFFDAWIKALPSPDDMDHPLLWSEEDQEVLQSSSTTKIYRRLDDLEDDATWLMENVFAKNKERYPETVRLEPGSERPCFNLAGFTWAMAIVQSRSFFLDGKIRLVPFLDMCNHDDDAEEVRSGTMGTFGTIKGAQIVASSKYAPGDEVFCSYGPKSAVDYLLEHGFCPPQCWKTSVSELTFELDPEDRFYDDKLDILEFETYDQAPMDPSQSFDLVSAPARDGEPDPAMIQFLRLAKLGGTDAFLLESIFRKEVWGFMELPVSEQNELSVVNTITDACERALEELRAVSEGGPEVCKMLREGEIKALSRTVEFLQREKEALDLKEYYQERRLKDLGLDSEWSPEDDMDPDLGFGQTRAPGGADYDW
jgi:[ribulose-bisphosphate carboxylase]-lysine N-methyltransferase